MNWMVLIRYLKLKTAIEFKNNDWKNGEIPKAYQLQVQHYLAVTGFQKAYIAVSGRRK